MRIFATRNGLPDEIPKDCKCEIFIQFWSVKKARGDLDNKLKAVLDALWKQDSRVTRIEAYIIEKCGVDKISVRVDFVPEKK